MKMTSCLSLSLALALSAGAAGSALGQSLQVEPKYTDLSDYLLSEGMLNSPRGGGIGGGNKSTITQSGQYNEANVEVNGFSNSTDQTQSGAHNTSLLILDGNNNSVSTTQI